jgi:hypothetical protein
MNFAGKVVLITVSKLIKLIYKKLLKYFDRELQVESGQEQLKSFQNLGQF